MTKALKYCCLQRLECPCSEWDVCSCDLLSWCTCGWSAEEKNQNHQGENKIAWPASKGLTKNLLWGQKVWNYFKYHPWPEAEQNLNPRQDKNCHNWTLQCTAWATAVLCCQQSDELLPRVSIWCALSEVFFNLDISLIQFLLRAGCSIHSRMFGYVGPNLKLWHNQNSGLLKPSEQPINKILDG